MAVATLAPHAEAIRRIKELFGLSDAELASLFGVKRQALAYWRTHGVPPGRMADVDRISELAERFGRTFKPARIPQIVRTPGRGLSNRTVLEVLAKDGPQPIFDYLYRLLSFSTTA
jgi:transcriptional regulator with XRE-family HTH domain